MELNIPSYEGELCNKNASFVKNNGQLGVFGQPSMVANEVVYYSNQPDFYDFVLRDRLSFVSAHSVDTVGINYNVNRMDLYFFNSETEEFQTLQPLPYLEGHAKRHFYTGLSDAGIENVPEYSELYFKDLYQGIGMSLSHNRMGLRAHFRVSAGYNPLTIQMKLDGLTSVNFTGGNLNIGAYQSNYQFNKPVAYQIDASDNINYVPVTWGIDMNGLIYFNMGDYDPSSDLYIAVKQGNDPILSKDMGDNLEWSSYIGEAGATTLHSVTTDNLGNVLYAGKASDVEFAQNIGFMSNLPYADGGDAFLIKFNENIEPQWYTFLGGDLTTAANVNATDVAMSITTFESNQIAMTGTSASLNLPMVDVLGGGYNGDQTNDVSADPDCSNCVDLFYARFTENGILNYSTYYGGEAYELPMEILMKNGDVYIVGERSSSTPLVTQAGASNFTDGTGFIMKMNNTNQLEWFNSFNVDRIMAATTNESNQLIIGGYIDEGKILPSANPSANSNFNAHNGSDFDGFIAVFDQNDILTHTAYYGGECQDVITDLKTDLATNTTFGVGTAYAYPGDIGCTNNGSGDIPLIGNGLPRAPWGASDHTYFKFTLPQANTPINFILSGYFSGDVEEYGTFSSFGIKWTRPSIAVLKNGAFAISGMSNSGDLSLGPKIPFPVNNPINFYQELSHNTSGSLLSHDAYIAVFDNNAVLRYTTFFGHGRFLEGPAELNYTNVNNKNRLYFAGNTGTINTANTPSNEVLFTEPYESGLTYNDYFRNLGPINQIGTNEAAWGALLSMDGLYDVLNLKEIYSGDGLVLFPNPTSNILQILSKDVITDIEIFSMDGKMVLKQNSDTNEVELNIVNLAGGSYLVKVYTNGQSSIYKIVRQ